MIFEAVVDIREKTPVASGITLTQADYNAYTLHIYVREKGQPAELTPYTGPCIALKKPDGTTVQGKLTRDGDHYVYPVGTNDVAAVGTVSATVVLYSEQKRISAQPFTFSVTADPLPQDALESATEFDALRSLLMDIEDKLENGDLAGAEGKPGQAGAEGAPGPSGQGVYPVLSSGNVLRPNTFYDFGEVSALSLTLEAPLAGLTTEYLFAFRTGATSAPLSLPANVRWTGGAPLSITAGKSYLVAILYAGGQYLAAGAEW